MKKIFILLFISFIVVQHSFSQEIKKRDLTLEDAILKRFSEFYPDYISGLQWKGKSNVLVKKSDDGLSLLELSFDKNEWDTLIHISDLNTNLDIDLKYFPRINWLNDSCIMFRTGYDYYKYNIFKSRGKKFTRIPIEGENIDVCNQSGDIAYTVKNNLYIKKPNGDCIHVTDFDDKNIVAGQSIARNEFGITKGTFWSKNGNYLAFYQKDETDVGDYPLVDITTREATLKSIKYPMAGMKSEYPSVGVFDIKTHKTVYLKTDNGEKDHYLTNLTWGPDEKFIYLAEINRAQNHMWFNKYDIITGEKVKTLFEEQHPKYVEPVDPAWFIPGHDNEFLWYSRRDGYKNLYRYNTEGDFLNKVTSGKYPIHNILGLDKTGKYIYVIGADESGLNEYLYKASLHNDKIKKITRQFGVHSYNMSSSGDYFIDIYSDIKTPRITQIINKKGKIIKQLLISDNPLKNVKTADSELLDIKAADGKTTLHARMIKPSDFDSSKKYKVLVYLYGGPHAQMVRNAWLAYAPLWMHYMANKGYIIFTLDNRGSDNRGFEFENIIHRNLGYNEMLDQMEGIKYLKSLPFVDTSKMAIHGWSFGGFMTTTMMLRQPDVFKVAVAGGPVINWKWYEVMYGERYMDMPEENPEGYKNNNLLNYVDNLKGNLMLIIGSVDPVVVPQHSLSIIKKFVEAKKQVDFFTYPMHEHNVRGVDRVHLMRKILDYIEDKLNN